MPTSRIWQAVVVVLVFALLLSSSLAIMYYVQYNQEVAANKQYASELTIAEQKYNTTARNYNALVSTFNLERIHYNGSRTDYAQLAATFNSSAYQFNLLSSDFAAISKQYNETISLLTSSLAVMNTSDSAYITSSRLLSSIWTNYTSLISNYHQAAATYSQLIKSFDSQLASFNSSNNATLGFAPTSSEAVPTALLTANILIDFGNGTSVWYNSTSIQPGWNLYVATLVITKGEVNSSWYPSYGEHLVDGIEGKAATSNAYWFAWTFGKTSWQLSLSGADQISMFNGSTYAWAFCTTNSSYLPTCTTP